MRINNTLDRPQVFSFNYYAFCTRIKQQYMTSFISNINHSSAFVNVTTDVLNIVKNSLIRINNTLDKHKIYSFNYNASCTRIKKQYMTGFISNANHSSAFVNVTIDATCIVKNSLMRINNTLDEHQIYSFNCSASCTQK